MLEVDEPAIDAIGALLPPVYEGEPSDIVDVAAFTHANGIEPAAGFTATVDWGIAGHHRDTGMVTQDGFYTYHVSATRPVFTEDGDYTVSVSIGDDRVATTITAMQVVTEPAVNVSPTAIAAI